MECTKIRNVHVMLLGGTIACTMTEDGGSTTVDIQDTIASLKELQNKVNLTIDSFCKLGGYETRISDLLRIAKKLNQVIAEDQPDGIVVVMGTNVMEEAAYALDLLIRTDIPIVVTGAIRIPESNGADGPANLADAITTAASENSAGMGVLVVLNSEIHSAQYVRKEHTLNCGALTSDFRLGFVAEGYASYRTRPVRRLLPWIDVKTDPKEVLLYTSYLGDTGELLDHLDGTSYEGLVVEGTGGGYTALWVTDKYEKLRERMPVVIAARPGHGDTMTNTYGNDYGMPGYFTEKGYLNAGQLDGRKARILLTLLLMSECSEEEIAKSFLMYSKEYIG